MTSICFLWSQKSNSCVSLIFSLLIADEEEYQRTCAVYLEPKTAESPYDAAEENRDTMTVVKPEPEDELDVHATTDNAAVAVSNLCFEAGQREESVWPPAACSLFEENSVAQRQQHMQIFTSHTEPFPAPRNTESSHNSSSAAPEEIAEDLLRVPIKVEVEIPPICMGRVAPESVHDEPYRHVSHPAASQEHQLQPLSSQRAGPSLAPAQKSTEDHILSRNNSLRAKRLINVWRSNQKLFICSVCNKGFHRLSQLEEHKATHQPFKPFRCLECGKSFTQKTRLKTHQSVHTGERPFSCKICGKMFSRQDNCLRHERFHSGLKPYSCGQCGKSFTVLANLKIHQEIHLKGR